MKRIACLAAALIFCAAHAVAAPKRAPKSAVPATKSALAGLELFQLDAPHSPIGFEVPWMGLSKVRGGFDDCFGTLVFDGQDLTHSSVTVAARTASLHTNNALRDKDLKGADWFDVEKFPIAIFRSTAIVRDGEGYRMRGSLSLHGVTRDVEFPFQFLGRISDKTTGVRVGFEGRLVVNRRDFGLVGPARFNVVTEMGKAMIGDEVEIPLAVEGWRQSVRDTLPDRTTDSLYRRVSAEGFSSMAKEYRARKAQTPDSLMAVNEAVLNSLGFAFLDRQKPDLAIQSFQLEAEAFPHSAFPHTGLAQAYATLGDSARAVASGKKALELNPNALRALEILRRVSGDID
jgi:polyisoprenoid-binding protein YceI